jgi:phosphate transport system protein
MQMNMMTDGHTVERYNSEMNHLHSLVLLIGDLVREQLKNAAESIVTEDGDLAQAVIDRDDEVNELDVRASDEIVNMIAKRQPVARDLREILTIGKIVTDLERVGDEVRKIARLTIYFYCGELPAPNPQILHDILRMVDYVDEMLEKAMQSFDQPDLNLALEVIKMNDEMILDFKSALRQLSTFIMEDSRNVGHVVETVLGLRAMERIAGHAKNIAGYVLFLVKGVDVRHASMEAVAEEVVSDIR